MKERVNRSASLALRNKTSRMQSAGEWLDAGSWKLPSGQSLGVFALRSGFIAPSLFGVPSESAWSNFSKTGEGSSR